MKLPSFRSLLFIISIFWAGAGCSLLQDGLAKDDGILEFQILQMNDVYEIAPLADGTGGLARVAGLRKQLMAKNPNTLTVLAGDFISPSVTGTLKYEGKRIKGRQMIDALNTLGLDMVVFGNHEFDYDYDVLQARLNQSEFPWLSGNAELVYKGQQQAFYRQSGRRMEPCPKTLVRTIKDKDGTEIKVGVFSVLVDSNKKDYVAYSDFMKAARELNKQLMDTNADVVLGLTHLDIDDDLKLAEALPNVPLIMGGHDHDNMLHTVGNVRVTKADANARTVYVHTLRHNKNTGKTTVESELIHINDQLPEEPRTAAVVQKWENIKNGALEDAGFDPGEVVIELDEPLECRDAYVRHQQMLVGKWINDAMLSQAEPKAACAVLNSGSIRVDDVLKGHLTELDIVRMLPFGGGIVVAEMNGLTLKKVLDIGTVKNKGKGGYLQIRRIKQAKNSSGWLVGNNELNTETVYRVVLPAFLLTGNETNLGFLKTNTTDGGKTTDNPNITRLYLPDKTDEKDLRNDIRRSLIHYLKNK